MTSRFRPDIEGLRALAILPILAFHLDPAICPGGFIGVDIFFVISGFLITGMILDQGQAFAFKTFYLRRVLRLLPALAVTVLATMVVAWRTLGPAEFTQLAKTAIAAIAGVSNFYFFATYDYFQPAGATQPLLHTWSLGLEEQVYLLWPALLVWSARSGRLAFSIGAVALLSFLVVFVQRPLQPQAVFYLMPFRLFEFAAGAALALLRPRFACLSPTLCLLGGGVAIVALAASMALFDGTTPWPGTAALVPTFATATLIAVGGIGVWHRVLTLLPLRWIGRVSYSLYLVHWPVIVLYRNNAIPDGGLIECVRLGGVALGLAILLFVLVESPFRDGAGKTFPAWLKRLDFGRGGRLAGSALLALSALGFAGAALATNGFPHRVDRGRVQAIDKGLTYAGDLCDSRRARCTFGATESDRIVYVVGDSHALNLIYGLDELFRDLNVRGIAFYDHGCLFAYGTKRFINGVADSVCMENVQRTYELLAKNTEPVIFAGEYSAYRNQMGSADSGTPVRMEEAQFIAWLSERLEAGLSLLNAANRRVIMFTQGYNSGVNVPHCWSQPGVTMETRDTLCPRLTRSQLRKMYSKLDEMIGSLAGRFPAVIAIDPKEPFCPDEDCVIVDSDGQLYLRDSSHLTNKGSAFLVGKLRPKLIDALGQ